MILKETILSAFDDRGTLLKWLKKVESALKDAVLTDFSVVQVSETEIKLKLTFEGGDSIDSPVLTLPRGEKGEQGEQGEQGKAASIRIGAVATGSPNTLANVTNSGTPEDAVLNFVIPQGEQGEQGEQGSAGVGFGDADEISINDGNINIIAGDNGVNIEASFEVVVGEEILEIPSTMYLPFKGSESIVIDVDESGDFIDIHLDADIAAKLGRVLVTPMSAPESVSLVAVDTSNAQAILSLGDGLSVSNGVLSASGGGGGGYDLQLNAQYDAITLKRIKYADGRAELNKTFTENTLLHNVVAVSFEAVSTAMAVSGAIITKSPYDEKVYCNALGGDTYITTGNGFTNNTQIILVGKCTMEWSSN